MKIQSVNELYNGVNTPYVKLWPVKCGDITATQRLAADLLSWVAEQFPRVFVGRVEDFFHGVKQFIEGIRLAKMTNSATEVSLGRDFIIGRISCFCGIVLHNSCSGFMYT
jgi:hypothetical protein